MWRYRRSIKKKDRKTTYKHATTRMLTKYDKLETVVKRTRS